MAISACEICGKPFNDALGKICGACSKNVDQTYIKVRKYMYQNPKNCEFITIVENTGVSEKELNWLIKKGRIEIADKPSGAAKCRACGKETSGSSLCDSCMAKIIAEKLSSKEEAKPAGQDPLKKGIIPKSYLD
jgi:NMD protein affecting ribosome stability and mRNA decay